MNHKKTDDKNSKFSNSKHLNEKQRRPNRTVIKESIDEKYEFPSDTARLERNTVAYNDDGTDKAFKHYDPKQDKRSYPVYRNDIKYKKHRAIDPSRAVWEDDVKNDFHNKDTDSVEYRIEECVREKYALLDLSHMGKDCFDKLFQNKIFLSIIGKINHLFAKESHLRRIPNLKLMSSLQTLDVSCNKLNELPELPESLEELIVNDNRLRSIQNNLPNLLRLNCDNNNIDDIKFSTSLERIHMKNNPVANIPDLNKLYYLDASATMICKIGHFPSLKHLIICSTKVETIKNLESLEIIDCKSSQVKYIINVPKIQSIDMVSTHVECLSFMNQLNRLTYTQSNNFKLSKKYKINSVKKNKNNIVEIIFKTNG
jgi:hypothetical protein